MTDSINGHRIAFIFPGQGSQAVGMGKDLAENYPIARQTFEEDVYKRQGLARGSAAVGTVAPSPGAFTVETLRGQAFISSRLCGTAEAWPSPTCFPGSFVSSCGFDGADFRLIN